jgi:hydroxymethylbilane synthase
VRLGQRRRRRPAAPKTNQRPRRFGGRGPDDHHIRDALQAAHPGLGVELLVVTTDGDRIQDRPLHEIGGKGLFVKGIEERLLAGDAELAVHSMKDLPAEMVPELVVAATPERVDPRDALVGPAGIALCDLPAGTRVGTGSLRRAALCARENPGVAVMPLRGNVPTRLRKVEQGELDAVIVAAAGLVRLGLSDRITEWIAPERFCPSPTQGILALQCRAADARTRALVAVLDHAPTAARATAERAFLRHLQAGCTVPMGCFAEHVGPGQLHVTGLVIGEGGRPYFRATKQGGTQDAARLGAEVGATLLEMGADAVLAAAR